MIAEPLPDDGTALVPAHARVVVVARATPENAQAACATLTRLHRAAGSDNVLLFWLEPADAVHVERLWDRERVGTWQRERADAAIAAARAALARGGLSAAIVGETCEPRRLGQQVDATGAAVVVVARPQSSQAGIGEDWRELQVALREVRRPLLVV